MFICVPPLLLCFLYTLIIKKRKYKKCRKSNEEKEYLDRKKRDITQCTGRNPQTGAGMTIPATKVRGLK